MSGSHLIRRLRNLDLESSEELELSTDPGPPKSPTKSPTKTKSSSLRPSAFHPYNLSASGMLHIVFCFLKKAIFKPSHKYIDYLITNPRSRHLC